MPTCEERGDNPTQIRWQGWNNQHQGRSKVMEGEWTRTKTYKMRWKPIQLKVHHQKRMPSPLDTSVHPKYQTSNASIGGKKEASVPIPSKQERNPTGTMDKDEDRITHVQGRSSPGSRGRALQEPTPGSNGSRPHANKRPARGPWIPLHGAGPLVYKHRQ